MIAGAVAASVSLLSRATRPDESTIIYFWGCALLIISAVMFIVDYLRGGPSDRG